MNVTPVPPLKAFSLAAPFDRKLLTQPAGTEERPDINLLYRADVEGVTRIIVLRMSVIRWNPALVTYVIRVVSIHDGTPNV